MLTAVLVGALVVLTIANFMLLLSSITNVQMMEQFKAAQRKMRDGENMDNYELPCDTTHFWLIWLVMQLVCGIVDLPLVLGFGVWPVASTIVFALIAFVALGSATVEIRSQANMLQNDQKAYAATVADLLRRYHRGEPPITQEQELTITETLKRFRQAATSLFHRKVNKKKPEPTRSIIR